MDKVLYERLLRVSHVSLVKGLAMKQVGLRCAKMKVWVEVVVMITGSQEKDCM